MLTPFPSEVIDALRCPVCESALGVREASEHSEVFACEQGHTFDRSKQGYLTLLGKHAQQKTADTLDMVTRRQRFLQAGHYAGFAQEVAALLKGNLSAKRVIEPGAQLLIGDLGAGPGYYAHAVTEAIPEATCLALDLSKRALQRAKGERVVRVVADVWDEMPLKDNMLDGAINVFAPRNGAEYARVLKPGAPLVVASPTKRHMLEVRSAADLIKIGRQDSTKKRDVREKLEPHFAYSFTKLIEFPLTLEAGDIEDLVMMGPNAHHTNLEDLQATIARLSAPFTVTFSVEAHLYFAL